MYRFSLYLGERYSLEEQFEICRDLGFNNLEISECLGGKPFSDMDIDSLMKKAIWNKLYIPLLNLSTPLEVANMTYMKEVVHKCSLMGIEYLNIGDFKKFDDVKKPLTELVTYCQLHRVNLCVENRNGCYINEGRGALFNDNRNLDMHMVFNPLEFVRSGYHPFLNVFYNGSFKNKICSIRVSDGIYAGGAPKLPGDGSAEIKELVSALRARNYRGYLSLFAYFDNQTIDDYRIIFRVLCKLISNM
jgi:sugar phosphate isomerase/epimerase